MGKKALKSFYRFNNIQRISMYLISSVYIQRYLKELLIKIIKKGLMGRVLL